MERIFWVVERFEAGRGGAYWAGGALNNFTFDIDSAVQFCRRQDGERGIAELALKDIQIIEHALGD